jgi:hypothetical protein
LPTFLVALPPNPTLVLHINFCLTGIEHPPISPEPAVSRLFSLRFVVVQIEAAKRMQKHMRTDNTKVLEALSRHRFHVEIPNGKGTR